MGVTNCWVVTTVIYGHTIYGGNSIGRHTRYAQQWPGYYPQCRPLHGMRFSRSWGSGSQPACVMPTLVTSCTRWPKFWLYARPRKFTWNWYRGGGGRGGGGRGAAGRRRGGPRRHAERGGRRAN